MKQATQVFFLMTALAALCGPLPPTALAQDLQKIAQYEIVNAVGLAGDLTPSLNGSARPHPCRAGSSTGSMGTRATRISFDGSHPACARTTPKNVNLSVGTMSTIVYYPQIIRSEKTNQVAQADLHVTSVTHPFTRGGSPKTLHLLAVTESSDILVQVNDRPVKLRRLAPSAIELKKTTFEIAVEGKQIATGTFDERNHGTCILFPTDDGDLRAIVTGATLSRTGKADMPSLEEIAQYQVVNAVGLPGELTFSLNNKPRPHPYPVGTTMGSMGTRAKEISYGGSHSACTGPSSSSVALAAGTVTTVVFHPEISRSKETGKIARADLKIATLTHPFTRRAGPKTLHLLVVTERPFLPVAVNGRTFPVKRLLPLPIELKEAAFEITVEGKQLARGHFDERDHFAFILFDAPDGELDAVVFD